MYFSKGHIGANTTHRTTFPEHELASTELGNGNKRMAYVLASEAVAAGACAVNLSTGELSEGAGWTADADFAEGEYGWVHRQDVGGTTVDDGDVVVMEYQGLALNAAANAVGHLVAPFAGVITRIDTILVGGALATGNATITAAIGGVGVTNGVVTITQSGSGAGDKDLAEPSALNVVAAGDTITLTVGGSATGDRTANVMVTIERS